MPEFVKSEKLWPVVGLDSDGNGIVVGASGKEARVPGVFPGEMVELHAPFQRNGVVRALSLKVVNPIQGRRKALCEDQERCGGCPWAGLERRVQIQWKVRMFLERAKKKGLQLLDCGVEAPDPEYAYRLRARLAWKEEGGRTSIGYRIVHGPGLVVPRHCHVLDEGLERLRKELTGCLHRHLKGEGEVLLGVSDTEWGGSFVLTLRSACPQPPSLYREVERLVEKGVLQGARVAIGEGTQSTADFGVAAEFYRDGEGRMLRGAPGGFRQAHRQAAKVLGHLVLEGAQAEGKRVLELYAGSGLFTLALAARSSALDAVEIDKDAAEMNRHNLKAHGLEAKVWAEDAGQVLAKFLELSQKRKATRPEVVVMDPPRGGAGAIIGRLLALQPERIVYVSCHAASLVDDLARLCKSYDLKRIVLVDLFPQTAHAEFVALLERHGMRGKGIQMAD